MQLTRDDVLKLAKLSRLRLREDEVESFRTSLVEILDYVRQLEGVDVSGLEPTYQVSGLTSQDDNATREDVVTDQINQEELFKNLPDMENGQIKVKRMIG